jgi:hypothetical protein
MTMRKSVIAIMVLSASMVACAVILPVVQFKTFKPSQARVLNNVITQTETAINAAVIVDTNATTTVTLYTPFEVGQVLIGGAGTGTNAMWYASGTTTNDWTQVSSYTE